MRRIVLRAEGQRKLGLLVLHSVALVDDDVLPGDVLEVRSVQHNVLVRSNEDVELFEFNFASQLVTFALLALVDEDLNFGSPLVELHRPVSDGCERHNYKERSLVLLDFNKVREERDRLNGLTQAHFIGQDAIQIVVVE